MRSGPRYIFIILVLLLAGCAQPYTYRQYGKAADGSLSAGSPETIRAGSDIEAYEKAMIKFGSRVVSSRQIIAGITDSQELRNLTPFPFGYTLLTPDGVDVRARIADNKRIAVEDQVFNSLEEKAASLKIHLDRGELLGRHIVK